ncbi:hypothetical protein Noda2021_10570 [Candidatus Dependentiae bacterium Noda2021]|nr:hypothetical protein Noda2021_10570 [Candidatus Dependentiae bacterium Noda2021]
MSHLKRIAMILLCSLSSSVYPSVIDDAKKLANISVSEANLEVALANREQLKIIKQSVLQAHELLKKKYREKIAETAHKNHFDRCEYLSSSECNRLSDEHRKLLKDADEWVVKLKTSFDALKNIESCITSLESKLSKFPQAEQQSVI